MFAAPSVSATGRAIISEARATDLAVAFVRQFGSGMRPGFEKAHGGPIDLAGLQLTGVVHGESPFAPLPANVAPPRHKFFGPYYLVEMSARGVKALSVAVSAYNQDIGLENGRLVLPTLFGNDFIPIGISQELPLGVPASAEVAAKHVAVQAGALVDAVETSRIASSQVLYVDFRGALFVPKAEQSPSIAAGSLTVNLRQDSPVDFEQVQLLPSRP